MRLKLSDDVKALLGGAVGCFLFLAFIGVGVSAGMHVIESIDLSLQKRRVEACHELAEHLTDGELSRCIDDALKPLHERRRSK